jgi:hypothetical protein
VHNTITCTFKLAARTIAYQNLKNWARKDLNLGPMDYESTALPLSYEP